MSVFRKYDAGALERTPLAKGSDCQVRAFATASGIGYAKAWEILYEIQGEQRACHLTLVESLDNGRIASMRKLSFPAKRGQRRMTGAQFCVRYPRGRFVLRMAGHVVCAKDGQLYDTGDCSLSCVYTAWELWAFDAERT